MLLIVTMGRRAAVNRLVFMFASLWCAAAANAIDARADHQLGTQYSPLRQINTGNVAKLTKACEFHTGDDPNEVKGLVAMEDQPSLIEGNLVVCSTNRRLIALDPITGQKRWEFDPGNNVGRLRKCRGITSWVDRDAAAGSECKTRIFLGTTDYRLVAVDAGTGQACSGFGKHGAVQMLSSKPQLWPGEVVATSNPAVIRDVVVVGSSVDPAGQRVPGVGEGPEAGDDRVIVSVETVYVLVDARTLTKLALPDQLRAALEAGAAGKVTDHAAFL